MIRLLPRLKKSKNLDHTELTKNFIRNPMGELTKRIFDLTVALIGLILLSPFFVFVAILIKRDSSGPVFYWGPRIGRHGVVFKMLKFRTMYETRESYSGLRITCKEDGRITPFGEWLRDTKLNEFPQLWNVLRGEMSLVGPRPEDPSISKTWPTKIAHEILSVRPGITSPASVVYRDEESMLHAGEVMRKYLHELSPDKMRLDQLYVRYRSFWLDLDVLLWTALLLIPRIKAYSPPEQLLFVGPVTRLIKRYISWFLLDFLIVFFSISFTGLVVRLFGPLNIGWLRAAEMALGFSMLYTAVGILLQNNRINWPKAPAWESGRLGISWFIATTTILGFHYYLGFTSLRIFGVIVVASLLSLFGIIIIRYRRRLVRGLLSRLMTHRIKTHATSERVLIVGSGRTAEQIAYLLDHPTYSGKFQVVGFIDDDLLSQGMKIYGSKVIGRVDDIQKIVKEDDIGLIILADNQMISQKYAKYQDMSRFSPARIVVAPDIFGSLNSLDDGSLNSDANDNLNDFQCQHCLARYTAHHGQHRSIGAYDFKEAPVLTKMSIAKDRKRLTFSGQKRKPV
jgi:lipopolysaccharide/colanic/teichoic acid biosynthesis glycosyltransferase